MQTQPVNYDLTTGDIISVNGAEWLITNTLPNYVVGLHQHGHTTTFTYDDLIEWGGVRLVTEKAEIPITKTTKGLKFGDRIKYRDRVYSVVKTGYLGVQIMRGLGSSETVSYRKLELAASVKLHQ